MNTVNLIGRLGRDPQIFKAKTEGGIDIAKFSIAISRHTGGDKEVTDWINITAFGKTADNVCKYLNKGSLVGIVGRIQSSSYQGKDGNTLYTTDVAASRVQFLEKRKGEAETKVEVAEGFKQVEPLSEEHGDELPF
jgi:single-strand DNA-binding protein